MRLQKQSRRATFAARAQISSDWHHARRRFYHSVHFPNISRLRSDQTLPPPKIRPHLPPSSSARIFRHAFLHLHRMHAFHMLTSITPDLSSVSTIRFIESVLLDRPLRPTKISPSSPLFLSIYLTRRVPNATFSPTAWAVVWVLMVSSTSAAFSASCDFNQLCGIATFRVLPS